jgi:hypothetical protein
MNDVVCENINNGFCTKNVHDAMMRMGGNESFLYIGGLFDPVFVCYWNEIPNLRHVERLKNYLIEKFCIKWVSQATVKKFGNDIINISHNGNFLTLSRKKDGVIKININFEEDFDTFIWKNTGQNQNISLYHKKYPYFEGDDCIRYLHQYLPFHLPQIEHVLKSVLQSDIFIDKSTINILDIGSGPATVPLALLKLSNRYEIT